MTLYFFYIRPNCQSVDIFDSKTNSQRSNYWCAKSMLGLRRMDCKEQELNGV